MTVRNSERRSADSLLDKIQAKRPASKQRKPKEPKPKPDRVETVIVTPDTVFQIGSSFCSAEQPRAEVIKTDSALKAAADAAFLQLDPLSQQRPPTPDEIAEAAEVPADPMAKWTPGPGWSPSSIEYQMFIRWATGAQYLQITVDPLTNPRRYGLPEVVKIIQAVERWYQMNYPEVHRQIKMKALTVLEAVSALAMEGYSRSVKPKVETITESNGNVTVKRTQRDGDTAFLKLAVDVQDKILKLCSEITTDSGDDQLIPSGLGRDRREVAAEYLQNISRKLGYKVQLEDTQRPD